MRLWSKNIRWPFVEEDNEALPVLYYSLGVPFTPLLSFSCLTECGRDPTPDPDLCKERNYSAPQAPSISLTSGGGRAEARTKKFKAGGGGRREAGGDDDIGIGGF